MSDLVSTDVSPSKYARVFILVVEIMQYSFICKHDFKSVLFVHKGRVFTGDFSGRSANDNLMAKTVDLPTLSLIHI